MVNNNYELNEKAMMGMEEYIRHEFDSGMNSLAKLIPKIKENLTYENLENLVECISKKEKYNNNGAEFYIDDNNIILSYNGICSTIDYNKNDYFYYEFETKVRIYLLFNLYTIILRSGFSILGRVKSNTLLSVDNNSPFKIFVEDASGNKDIVKTMINQEIEIGSNEICMLINRDIKF